MILLHLPFCFLLISHALDIRPVELLDFLSTVVFSEFLIEDLMLCGVH